MSQSTGICKILLAVDGSEHSLAAATLLADIPLPPTCQVHALGIFLPREASYYTRLLEPLQKIQTDLEEHGIQVSTETLAGSPAQVLSEYAEAQSVDLIVLGAKGRRATLGIFLGGVAQQILEYSKNPVLVVRAPYTGLGHALLVTDGSAHSDMAVSFLGRFPLPANTKLSVMHVLPPLPMIEPPPAFTAWSPRHDGSLMYEPGLDQDLKAIEAEEEEQGEHLLSKTIDQIKRLPGFKANTSIQKVLRRGDAATEIIQFVNENQVNLIIAGSRGLSQVQSWLLGSVSRKLVHYAGCSVLIVRGNPQSL